VWQQPQHDCCCGHRVSAVSALDSGRLTTCVLQCLQHRSYCTNCLQRGGLGSHMARMPCMTQNVTSDASALNSTETGS
jgi:hypothetical protein